MCTRVIREECEGAGETLVGGVEVAADGHDDCEIVLRKCSSARHRRGRPRVQRRARAPLRLVEPHEWQRARDATERGSTTGGAAAEQSLLGHCATCRPGRAEPVQQREVGHLRVGAQVWNGISQPVGQHQCLQMITCENGTRNSLY